MKGIQYLTREQAAIYLGMTVSGIDYLRRVGRKNRLKQRVKLTPVKRGKYLITDVEKFKRKEVVNYMVSLD